MLLYGGPVALVSWRVVITVYCAFMTDNEPTVRGRELGEGMRAALTGAGLTGKAIAKELGWNESDVSRMLTGRKIGSENDVAAFLGRCKVSSKERRRLLALCREANKPGWYQQHGSRLPTQLRTYIDHEDNAAEIYDYQAQLLPGSLQTGDYCRNVISNIVNVPEDEVDARVAARLARAGIFSRARSTKFTFLVHELVLRLPVGGKAVMSAQLHHLLRMSVRPNINLQVIPAALGAHAGVAGSFIFMKFSGRTPVVYIESETTAQFLEEPMEIVAHRQIIDSLAANALDEAQSRDLISSLVVELYQE